MDRVIPRANKDTKNQQTIVQCKNCFHKCLTKRRDTSSCCVPRSLLFHLDTVNISLYSPLSVTGLVESFKSTASKCHHRDTSLSCAADFGKETRSQLQNELGVDSSESIIPRFGYLSGDIDSLPRLEVTLSGNSKVPASLNLPRCHQMPARIIARTFSRESVVI